MPVDEEELKVFLGLTILTGIVSKRCKIATYWSRDERLATPYFNDCMARDRFQLISKYLHFNDNSRLPENTDDKLYKIRPVMDTLISRWQALYDPGEHVSIEEGILKWRGRLNFRVSCKNKPAKHGVRSYILADSISKYCWNLDVHCRVSRSLKETATGLLTSKCFGVWHSLHMSSYCNSVALSEYLFCQPSAHGRCAQRRPRRTTRGSQPCEDEHRRCCLEGQRESAGPGLEEQKDREGHHH